MRIEHDASGILAPTKNHAIDRCRLIASTMASAILLQRFSLLSCSEKWCYADRELAPIWLSSTDRNGAVLVVSVDQLRWLALAWLHPSGLVANVSGPGPSNNIAGLMSSSWLLLA